MQKYYKYQYRFNASHSFDMAGSNPHMHTFTVVLYTGYREGTEQVMFYGTDNVVNAYLQQYEQQFLNELPAFLGKVPDIETIGDVFYEDISKILKKIGMRLYQLDIFENPLRVYQISSKLMLPACYTNRA